MKKLMCVSALLLAMSSAHAVDSIRWDSATFAYQTIDFDDSNVELSGIALSATKTINRNFFVAGEFSTSSDDQVNAFGVKREIDLDTLAFGVGYRSPLSKKTDLYGLVSYIDYDLEDTVGRDVDDSGLSFKTGVRSLVSPNVELGGALNYAKIDGDADTGFDVSAMYHLNEQFSAGVGYASSGDADGMALSMSVFF